MADNTTNNDGLVPKNNASITYTNGDSEITKTTKDGYVTTTTTTTPSTIGVNTKLKSKFDYAKSPSTVAQDVPKDGALSDFVAISKKTIDDYNLTPEKRKATLEKMASGMTLYESIMNVAVEDGLRRLDLSKYDAAGGPGGITQMDIDTLYMRKWLDDNTTIGAHQKVRYTKALNVLANAKNRGFSVIRSDDGRYWLESEEGGVKKYAINGLLDVKEIVDLVYDKAPNDTLEKDSKKGDGSTVSPKKKKKIVTEPGEDLPEDIITNGFEFTEAEKWYSMGFITDVGTTVLGMATKPAGGLIGATASLVGGIVSIGMEGYADYLSGKSAGDIAINAGARLALEGAEAVTFAPWSIMNKLRKGNIMYNLFKKAMHYGMGLNLVATAFDKQNAEIIKKLDEGSLSDLTIDDWRQITRVITGALAVGSIVGTHVGSRRRLKREATNSVENGIGVDTKLKQIEASSRLNEESIKPKLKKKFIEKEKVIAKKDLDKIRTNKDEGLQAKKQELKDIETNKKGTIEDAKKEITFLTGKKLTAKQKKINAQQRQKVKGAEKVASEETGFIDTRIKMEKESAKNARRQVGKDARNNANTRTENTAGRVSEKARKELAGRLHEKSKGKPTPEQMKAEHDTKDIFGYTGGTRQINKARKKAGMSTEADIKARKPQSTNEKKVANVEKKIESNKKKQDLVSKKLKSAEGNEKTKLLTSKKNLKEAEKVLNKELKLVKKTTGGPSKVRKVFTNAGRIEEVLSYNALPNSVGTVRAALKSLTLSDLSYVSRAGKHKKHKIYTNNSALTTFLTEAGYKESLVKELNVSEKQDLMRYVIYYKNARPPIKRAGGVFKMLIPKKVIKAQQGFAVTHNPAKLVSRKVPAGYASDPNAVATVSNINYADILKPPVESIDYASILKPPTTTELSKVTPYSSYYYVTADGTPVAPGVKTPYVVSTENPGKIIPYDENADYNDVNKEFRGLVDGSNDKGPNIEGAVYVDQNGQVTQDGAKTEWILIPKDYNNETKAGRIYKLDANGGFNDFKDVTIAGYVQEGTPVVVGDLSNTGDLGVVPTTGTETTRTPEEIARIQKEYDNAKTLYGGPDPDTGKRKYVDILKYIQPGDFVHNGDILEENYIRSDVQPVIEQTTPVRDMAYFDRSMSKLSKQPILDTADYFAGASFKRKVHNDTEVKRQDLIARNNESVLKQREANMRITNRNIASNMAAMNQNIMQENQMRAQSAQSRLVARQKQLESDNKRYDNILNGTSKFIRDLYENKQNRKDKASYNDLVQKRYTYKNEWEPRILALISEGKMEDAMVLKTKFAKEYKVHPDVLLKTVLNAKGGVDNPLDVSTETVQDTTTDTTI